MATKQVNKDSSLLGNKIVNRTIFSIFSAIVYHGNNCSISHIHTVVSQRKLFTDKYIKLLEEHGLIKVNNNYASLTQKGNIVFNKILDLLESLLIN